MVGKKIGIWQNLCTSILWFNTVWVLNHLGTCVFLGEGRAMILSECEAWLGLNSALLPQHGGKPLS